MDNRKFWTSVQTAQIARSQPHISLTSSADVIKISLCAYNYSFLTSCLTSFVQSAMIDHKEVLVTNLMEFVTAYFVMLCNV